MPKKRRRKTPRRKTLVELPVPEWFKDPRAYPGQIILPEEYRETLAPRRLMLSPKALAQQLRCSRQIVKAWMRIRGLHEVSEGESKASLGLCAEDLAALSLTGLLIRKYAAPLRQAAVCFKSIFEELLNAQNPSRTILAILLSNRGYEFQVSTSLYAGDFLLMTIEEQRWTHVYDCSQLRNGIDRSIDVMPLNLPSAESCKVQR